MKSLLSGIWPSIIWTAIIFILLVMPTKGIQTETVNQIPYLDKYVHVILFAVFSFLWFSFLSTKNNSNGNRLFLGILIFGSLYGLGMEFVQKHFADRDFSLMDAAADAFGSFIGLLPKKSPYGNRGRNQN